MIERHIQGLHTDDAGQEAPGATRERLKASFPPGATRRMTTLGLLVGSTLSRIGPREDETLVYASAYAESCALEGFLDSFPTPSPTLFQTSIHPSAVQQLMIGGQRPVREFLPLSGGRLLAFHALRASLLATGPGAVLCGGEEKGTWLLEHGLASDRTFAFAARLGRQAAEGTVGTLRLDRGDGTGELGLPALFDLLHGRRAWEGFVAPGWRLSITWR